MHAVIRRYQVSDVAALSKAVQDEFVPMARQIPGFVAYYVVDAGGGELASITVCDDEAGVEESTRRAADWVGQSVSQYITGGPDVFAGEVTASS